MKPDLVIYHGPSCLDGFTAAWVAWRRFPDAEFVAMNYGDEAPDMAGRHVLIVDFSLPEDALAAAEAKSLVVLDHHKTAQEALAGYMQDAAPYEVLATLSMSSERPVAVFDMDQSGAMLAWKALFPSYNVPRLVKSVQDRDLWQFKLAGSRELCAVLYAEEFEFELWSQLSHRWENDSPAIMAEGAAILKYEARAIRQAVKASARMGLIGGHEVPICNVPYQWASVAGDYLAQNRPFAALYYDRADGQRQWSLRSRDGVDVSEVAQKFGGGGHPGAAGFTTVGGWDGDKSRIKLNEGGKIALQEG